MMELKYSDVLKLNKELGNNLKSSSYDITVLSNIIVHQSKEMLEYLLRGEGINANVDIGDYDNIIQDSQKYKDSNAIIIFWELCNIIDGLQYKMELLNNDKFNEIIEKVLDEKGNNIINQIRLGDRFYTSQIELGNSKKIRTVFTPKDLKNYLIT